MFRRYHTGKKLRGTKSIMLKKSMMITRAGGVAVVREVVKEEMTMANLIAIPYGPGKGQEPLR